MRYITASFFLAALATFAQDMIKAEMLRRYIYFRLIISLDDFEFLIFFSLAVQHFLLRLLLLYLLYAIFRLWGRAISSYYRQQSCHRQHIIGFFSIPLNFYFFCL